MPVTVLAPPREWPTLGWTAIDWIEHYLCHGPGDVQGEPIVLDDEFAQILLDLYRLYPRGHELEGRRVVAYGAISFPKGRAKSELAGALCCFELCGPCRFDGWDASGVPVGRPQRYPMIRPLATEEGQAGNTYGNVVVMLEHARDRYPDEWGFGMLDIGATRTLLGGRTGGEIRPSTAGAASKDGGKETFAVADEVHLYTTPELRSMHAMVRRNARKRRAAEPWMLATTTMHQPGAGSVGEDLHREAHRLAESKSRHFGFYWYHREGFDLGDRWDDDDAQVESLREAYGPFAAVMDLRSIVLDEIRAAGAVRADAERYWHNRVARGESRAVDPVRWDELAAPERTPTGGEEVVLAFDGSDRGERADDTVLVGWTVDQCPHLFLLGRWSRPDGAGRDWRIPRSEVRAAVAEAVETFDVRRLVADPPFWREQIDEWAEQLGTDLDGDPVVVEFPTNQPTRMGAAIDRFLEALDERSFTHDGSFELRRYALNAILGTSARGAHRALVKPTDADKIDGLVAAVIGFDEVTRIEAATVDLLANVL